MNRRGLLAMFGAAMTLPVIGRMGEERSRGRAPRKGSLEHHRIVNGENGVYVVELTKNEMAAERVVVVLKDAL
jgi:hypothetical protein